MKKICFVSLGCYPILSSDSGLTYVGGAELQQVLIGSKLAKQGYKVTFITYDEKGEIKPEYDDIAIIKSFHPTTTPSPINKARKLWKSLKEANADVYIQQGGTPGSVVLFCKIHKKSYIKWIASDRGVLLQGITQKTRWVVRIAQYIDIKFAKKIIVQNSFQQQIIQKKFHKPHMIIKNPIAIPPDSSKNSKYTNTILWVGTIRDVKQPNIVLQLAKDLPQYNFTMIGGPSDEQPGLFTVIKKEAQTISNLNFLGFVSPNIILKHFQKASVFINTSKVEGFPNTFLEAWISHTPVISLKVDPDNIISSKKLGNHSKTYTQMKKDIQRLCTDEKTRETYGKNGRKYVEKYHSIAQIIKQFEQLIDSVS